MSRPEDLQKLLRDLKASNEKYTKMKQELQKKQHNKKEEMKEGITVFNAQLEIMKQLYQKIEQQDKLQKPVLLAVPFAKKKDDLPLEKNKAKKHIEDHYKTLKSLGIQPPQPQEADFAVNDKLDQAVNEFKSSSEGKKIEFTSRKEEVQTKGEKISLVKLSFKTPEEAQKFLEFMLKRGIVPLSNEMGDKLRNSETAKSVTSQDLENDLKSEKERIEELFSGKRPQEESSGREFSINPFKMEPSPFNK